MAGSAARAKRTAEAVAAIRAAGARERDARVRNDDYMARAFLGPRFSWMVSVLPARLVARRVLERRFPGAFGYFTVRTKHMDAVLLAEVERGIDQLVILGAGYDSRAYRFGPRLEGVRVFEVDHPDTSARKTGILERLYGTLPPHVAYVPVDLQVDPLGARLDATGYRADLRTLFVWEGVTYYISRQAVEETLGFVRERSGPGSSIVFDYAYRDAVEGTIYYAGLRELADWATRRGEPYVFGLDQGAAPSFLAMHGLDLVSHLDAGALARRYLAGPDGEPRAAVAQGFCIAQARRRASGA